MTNADRQAAFRKRQKEAGLVEVRGIYAKPKDHQKIREAAKQITNPLDTDKK